MNNKGFIFTLDAMLALLIFIGLAIGFTGFFSDTTVSGLTHPNIYVQSQNFISVMDSNESFSSAYKLLEEGNASGGLSEFTDLLNEHSYDSNGQLFSWNGTDFESVFDVRPNSFEDMVLVRRYIIMTTTEGFNTTGGNLTINATSTQTGENATLYVTLANPTASNFAGVVMTPTVYDSNSSLVWTVTPASRTINVTAGENESRTFTITVPGSAIIGEYYVNMSASGGYSETAIDPFNVIKFGLIELEVGI